MSPQFTPHYDLLTCYQPFWEKIDKCYWITAKKTIFFIIICHLSNNIPYFCPPSYIIAQHQANRHQKKLVSYNCMYVETVVNQFQSAPSAPLAECTENILLESNL